MIVLRGAAIAAEAVTRRTQNPHILMAGAAAAVFVGFGGLALASLLDAESQRVVNAQVAYSIHGPSASRPQSLAPTTTLSAAPPIFATESPAVSVLDVFPSRPVPVPISEPTAELPPTQTTPPSPEPTQPPETTNSDPTTTAPTPEPEPTTSSAATTTTTVAEAPPTTNTPVEAPPTTADAPIG